MPGYKSQGGQNIQRTKNDEVQCSFNIPLYKFQSDFFSKHTIILIQIFTVGVISHDFYGPN